MTFYNKDIYSENELDNLIERYEQRQKKSFWRGFVLAICTVSLLSGLVFVTIKALSIRNKELVEAKEHVEALEIENKENLEVIIEASDLIEETVDEKVLNDSVRVKLENTKKLIGRILKKEDLKIGDSLYVWSKSGLNIRSEPRVKKGNIVGGNVLGEFVILVNDSINHKQEMKTNLTIKNMKIPIEGVWLMVEKWQKGYIFDGYLSRLPSFKDTLDLASYYIKLPQNTINKFNIRYSQVDNTLEYIKLSSISINEALLLIIRILDIEEKTDNESTLIVAPNKWTFNARDYLVTLERKGIEITITQKLKEYSNKSPLTPTHP